MEDGFRENEVFIMGFFENMIFTPGVILCFFGLALMVISLILMLCYLLTGSQRKKKLDQKLSERY